MKKQAIWPTNQPTSRMWWDNTKINLKLWGYKIQHDMTFTMLVWRLKSIQCMPKNNVVHLVTLGFYFRILLLPLGTKTVEFFLIGLTFIKTCLNIILLFPCLRKHLEFYFNVPWSWTINWTPKRFLHRRTKMENMNLYTL